LAVEADSEGGGVIRSVRVRVHLDGDDDVDEASAVFGAALERALTTIRSDGVIRSFEVIW
jgi:hypothetical protein